MKLLFFFIFNLNLWAYEVDQFTRRDEVPIDSTTILDQEIKKRLTQALADTNSGVLGTSFGAQNCSGTPEEQKNARFKLFENIHNQLVTQNPIGIIESFAEKNKDISKRTIPLSESIYKTSLEESLILKKFGVGSIIQVNGVQIGTDKLGHFFNEGYDIYLQNKNRQRVDEKASAGVRDSRSSEQGRYGLQTTLIKSYADMSTNQSGFRFWEKLCGFPTKEKTDAEKNYFQQHKCNPDAYLKCVIDEKTKKGHWDFNPNQKFTLKDYVTDAWDESINCNSFDEKISGKVFSEMTRTVYTFKGNPKQPCPAEPQKCANLVNNPNSDRRLLNPLCLKVGTKINKGEKIDSATKYDYTYQGEKKPDRSERPGVIKRKN